MIYFDNPIFVHVDTLYGVQAAKKIGAKFSSGTLQIDLNKFLMSLVVGEIDALHLPAFNYDYADTRIFNVLNDPVQVGSFIEWLRLEGNMVRSHTPFYSFLSGKPLNLKQNYWINPFGQNSGFHWLAQNDAYIVFLGAPLKSVTFIHYVEELLGKPLYRYDKVFPGKILYENTMQNCEVSMHVRPSGANLEYDWIKIENELTRENLICTPDETNQIKWIKVKDLIEFWGNKITDDPFYLLNPTSIDAFSKATRNGTQRVRLNEYES